MNRPSTAEMPTSKQSIYPMTRQELAVPPVSWIRLRPAKLQPDHKPTHPVPAAKFAPLTHGNHDTRSTNSHRSDTTPQQNVSQRHSIVQNLRASEPAPSSDEMIEAGRRTDIPERSEVPKPKFLKHAVRFGKSVTPLVDDAPQNELVGKFQRQTFSNTIEKSQLESLRGVDSRGQVYTATAEKNSESKTRSTQTAQSALREFLGEYHRSVDSLPVIHVTPNPSSVVSPKRVDNPIATPASASVTTAIEPQKEHPYWMQAIIQIIIGTIIVILLMNLHQLLRNGNPMQTIESTSESQNFYPVERANLEVTEDFQFSR